MWVKPGSEQSFLYGNNILKNGMGRITENTEKYTGLIVYNMADIPLVNTFDLFFIIKYYQSAPSSPKMPSIGVVIYLVVVVFYPSSSVK